MTSTQHCQRWNRQTMSWQYADPDQRFRGRGFDVKTIEYLQALDFVREHHYLR